MLEVERILDKWGENIVYLMKQKLQAGNKVASGNLINSLSYRYRQAGNNYTLEITGAPYLINVDRGRRPGKYVPIQPLINWIKVRRIPIKIIPNVQGNTQARKTAQKNAREKAIRGMAFAISTKIKQRGIKAFPILQVATAANNSQKFKQEIAKAVAKDISKQISLR